MNQSKPILLDWTPDCVLPTLENDNKATMIWRVDLDDAEILRRVDLEILGPDERDRADRLRMPVVSRRFRIGRCVLRTVLGRLLGQDPAMVAFSYGPLGKPRIVSDYGAGLSFNLSHSEGVALIAACRAGEIGVDVEVVRPMDDRTGLVRRYFAEREAREFETLPEAERGRAFLTGWTRKEAVIKATGEGIAANLEAIDVGFCRRPAGFCVPLLKSTSVREAFVWDLDVAPDVVAAVARV